MRVFVGNRFDRRSTQLHQTVSKSNAGHISDLDVFKGNYEENNTGQHHVLDVSKIRFAHLTGTGTVENVQLFGRVSHGQQESFAERIAAVSSFASIVVSSFSVAAPFPVAHVLRPTARTQKLLE